MHEDTDLQRPNAFFDAIGRVAQESARLDEALVRLIGYIIPHDAVWLLESAKPTGALVADCQAVASFMPEAPGKVLSQLLGQVRALTADRGVIIHGHMEYTPHRPDGEPNFKTRVISKPRARMTDRTGAVYTVEDVLSVAWRYERLSQAIHAVTSDVSAMNAGQQPEPWPRRLGSRHGAWSYIAPGDDQSPHPTSAY